MAAQSQDEEEIKLRIRRWLRHYWRIYEPIDVTQKKFAKRIGVSPAHLSNLMSPPGKKPVSCGLKVLANMRDNLPADLNLVISEEPPKIKESQPGPAQASPANAEQGRRRGAHQ